MGYRGKFMTNHTGIELPKEFVDKYKDDYYIGKYNGKYYLNISSKREEKSHIDIILDLQDLLRFECNYDVWAIELWEDGKITKYNLSTGLVTSVKEIKYF